MAWNEDKKKSGKKLSKYGMRICLRNNGLEKIKKK